MLSQGTQLDEHDESMRKQIINKSSCFPHLEKNPTYIQKSSNLWRGVSTSIIIII